VSEEEEDQKKEEKKRENKANARKAPRWENCRHTQQRIFKRMRSTICMAASRWRGILIVALFRKLFWFFLSFFASVSVTRWGFSPMLGVIVTIDDFMLNLVFIFGMFLSCQC